MSARMLSLLGAVLCLGLILAPVLLGPGLAGAPVGWVVVAGKSMLPSLQNGDVVVVRRRDAYRDGDVIAFRVPEGEPGQGTVVIHRIVGGSAAKGYVVRGDNKEGVDPWRPRPQDVIGVQMLRVPRAGLAVAFIRTPLGLAALAALITASIVAGGTQVPPARPSGS